jgi:hypothetical protein
MLLAARMICSSSARFILLQNGTAFLLCEDAAEWAGLPQPASVLVRAGEEVEDAIKSPVNQDVMPFDQNGRCSRPALLQPSL